MVELRTSIPHNGWRLGDMAEIEAQNCNFALNCHIAKTNVVSSLFCFDNVKYTLCNVAKPVRG